MGAEQRYDLMAALSGASLRGPAPVPSDPFSAAYNGANGGAQYSDWGVTSRDPNDVWRQEGVRLADRSEDLLRNNPYAVAMAETLIDGSLGALGLTWRSLFQADSLAETTEADERIRGICEREVEAGFCGTAFDAAGMLAKRGMEASILASAIGRGDGLAVKTFKPGRLGPHTHGTCWRLIHTARLCNPGWVSNGPYGTAGARLHDGLEFNASGEFAAVHILRRHPYSMEEPSQVWDRIEVWGKNNTRNVVHLKRPGQPDQARGVGWLAPILTMLQHLGKTEEAYVVAKRIQACSVYVVEVEDPVAAAGADARGAVLGPNTKIVPGRVYYVKKGSAVNFLNGNFNGADLQQFENALLTGMAATLNMPVDYVLKQLTKSNLASARAALMQAWATFQLIQELMIVHVEQPWVESLLDESWAMGRIPVSLQDKPALYRGRYRRPPTAFPDPLREAEAGRKWLDMGASWSGVLAANGRDFQDEIRQRARDEKFAKKEGIDLHIETVAERIVTEPKNPQDANAPAGGNQDDDKDPADPADPADDEADEKDQGAAARELVGGLIP